MTVAMTEKQKREIMRKGVIASTKIIEKLEIRIEELEKENKELKANYNKALSDVVMLTEENKKLKEKLEEFAKELIQHHEEYKNMADMVVELQEENKELRENLNNISFSL